MLTDEQLRNLEIELNSIYERGGDPSQIPTLNCYQTDPQKILILQQIVENPYSSNIMNHFALLSLRFIFEVIYKSWDFDTYTSYQEWCLQNLFNKAESLELLSIDAFCKLYGLLFSCGFQMFENFQLQVGNIDPFLNSDKSCHIEIGLNLCSNIIYSINNIKDKILFNNQTIFFKETTMLTCYLIGANIFNRSELLDESDIISFAVRLIIDCLTFDEDIMKETSMIFLPRTDQWNEALSNATFLLQTISDIYFNNGNWNEIRSKILDLIYYLTSVRLDYTAHIQYLNCAIKIILQIIEMNPAFEDPDNIGKINLIILKINLSIVSNDAAEIPLFDQFITSVFNYTMQFFDVATFSSNSSDFLTLLNFWLKISPSYLQSLSEPLAEEFNSKLANISQNLYDTLIGVATSNIDMISEFGFSFFSHISSFVYTIGQNNDREFFEAILTNFEQFQNELYECYNHYLSGDEYEGDYPSTLNSFELKVAYSAMIISAPIIRVMNVHDDILVGLSMSSLIHFFINSEENITKNAINSRDDEAYECLLTENVVTYLISRIERGSNMYIEKSFTSFAIENSPIKMVEKLHSYFLKRLLSIAKFYQKEEPIFDSIFNSILSFYSLRLDDVTNVYLVDTFLEDFLYANKKKLKPNKRSNIFQSRIWRNKERIKFHRIFSVLLSKSSTNQSNFESRKVNFMFYLRDLKERIEKMSENWQAEFYLCDLYGLFRGTENAETYFILSNYFFLMIPRFGSFQVNFHFIFRFLAEFTENRFNRITDNFIKKIKPSDEKYQEKSLNDLLIFREIGSYLIEFYELFDKSSETLSNELKYVFRILTNIFSFYSSCIGAMKLYNDDVYQKLFPLIVFNTSFVILDIKKYICYDAPTNKDIKLVYLILSFLTVLGNKENLFVDVFEKNDQFFKNIFFFVTHILISSEFSVADILTKIFELIDLITGFFLANKNNRIGEFFVSNKKEIESLLIFINNNILAILQGSPRILNHNAVNLISNIYFMFPSLEFAKKLDESIGNLAQMINNKELFDSLYDIHDLLDKQIHATEEEEEG